MEKVKITQTQADNLEWRQRQYGKHRFIEHAILGHFDDVTNPVEWDNLDVLIRALYVGYEVVPEFKENDWVIRTSDAGRGHEKGKVFRIVERISSQNIHGDDEESHVSTSLKHATDEEIATEKQRRFWNGNDRDVWELRKGDVLESQKNGKLVTVLNESNSLGGCLRGLGHIRISDLKSSFKVVCFAEDRKDIN